jgi:hypothetical protein
MPFYERFRSLYVISLSVLYPNWIKVSNSRYVSIPSAITEYLWFSKAPPYYTQEHILMNLCQCRESNHINLM